MKLFAQKRKLHVTNEMESKDSKQIKRPLGHALKLYHQQHIKNQLQLDTQSNFMFQLPRISGATLLAELGFKGSSTIKTYKLSRCYDNSSQKIKNPLYNLKRMQIFMYILRE